jgi:hypothetical protein
MNKKIKLQTLLSSEARNALYREGRIVGDKSRILLEDFKPAYQWMANKRKEKISSPPDGVEAWPVWAWFKKDETGSVNPNDEEYEGQDLWLLTFEADPDQVVMSDFGDWHHVLNGWYLPNRHVADDGLAEDEAFCNELESAGIEWAERPYPQKFWDRVTKSWERIFDVRNGENGVQATFWVLNASQIISEVPCRGTVPELTLKCA